jgi:ADP-heptose:LPS heptosyltransferase
MPNLSVEPQPPDAKQKAEEIVSALDGYPRYVIHLKAREPSRSLPNGKAMEVVESIGRLGPTLVLAYPPDQWFKALPRRSNVIWLSAEQTAENARTMLHLTILFIQQAEYVVAVDSFALHVAGTYGKKTVMLEGPTKGSVVAAMYPNTRYIHGSMDTICKPYCYFDTSKGWSLVCRTHGCLWLRSIDVDDILEEIRG